MSLGDGDSGFEEQDPQQENTTSEESTTSLEADTQAATDPSVKIAGLTLSNDGFLPAVGLTNAEGDTIATLKASSVLKLFDLNKPLTAEDFKFADGITSEQQQQIVTEANQYCDQIVQLFFEQNSQYSYDLNSQEFYDNQNSKEISLMDILKLLIQLFNQTVVINSVVTQQQEQTEVSTFEIGIIDSEGNKSTLKSSKYPLTMDNVKFTPKAPENAKDLLDKINDCYAETMKDLSDQYPGLTFKSGEPLYDGKPLTPEQFAGNAHPFTDGISFNDRFKDTFNKNAAKYDTPSGGVRMISSGFTPQATQSQSQNQTQSQNQSVTAELTAGQELNAQPETNSTQQAEESGEITPEKAREQLEESLEEANRKLEELDAELAAMDEELAELENQDEIDITDDEVEGLERELEELMLEDEVAASEETALGTNTTELDNESKETTLKDPQSDSNEVSENTTSLSEDSTLQQQTEMAPTEGASMSPKPNPMLSKATSNETDDIEQELLSSAEQKPTQSPGVDLGPDLDGPDIDLPGLK